MVRLFLGFLQDHVDFYLQIVPFFPRFRRNLADLNSVTHRSQKTTELVYKPVMNLSQILIGKSADDLHMNQDEKRSVGIPSMHH